MVEILAKTDKPNEFRAIASISTEYLCCDRLDHEDKANINLMGTSPELLAALEMALDDMRYVSKCYHVSFSSTEEVERVIAKAKGNTYD